MSDSNSFSGNPGDDVTSLPLANHAADQIRFDREALDGFPSEISEDGEHVVSQPQARRTTNKNSLFAFEIDAAIKQSSVFPDTQQAPIPRRRTVLREALSESARRGWPITAAATQRAVRVSQRFVSTALRTIRLGLLAPFFAVKSRDLATVVNAVYRHVGRMPRPRPLAVTVVLSLMVVAATFDSLTGRSAGSVTKAVTPGVLPSDAIEPAVLTPVRVNAVMPFERLRSPMPQLRAAIRARPVSRRVGPANDRRAIQSVLNRYRDALSILDVAAVRAVWPSVDVAAVRSAFARVVDQNVEFEACRISSAGAKGTASCSGVLESGLNPGHRRPRSERKRWQFTLHKNGNRWQISNVISVALTGQTNGRANAAR